MTQSYILWIVEVNTHAFIVLHVATLNFIDRMNLLQKLIFLISKSS